MIKKLQEWFIAKRKYKKFKHGVQSKTTYVLKLMFCLEFSTSQSHEHGYKFSLLKIANLFY